jgi:plastocyanin
MRLAVAPAVAAAASIIVLAAVLLAGEGAAAQSTTTIDVSDLYFCDPLKQNSVCETTVTEGDTVEWRWIGNLPHTTTACADDLDACSAPHLWDSPAQNSGSFSYTFETPGTYLYRCQLHEQNMRGRITVVAAAQASPEPEPSPEPSLEPTEPATTPAPTPTAVARVSAVPSGGGPPGSGGGEAWWLAIAGGGAFIAGGALLALSVARRRRA